MSSYLRYVDFFIVGEVVLSHVLSGNGTIMAKTKITIKILCFNPRHKVWVGIKNIISAFKYPPHYPPQNSQMNLNSKMLINFHLEIEVNMLVGGNCLLVYKDSSIVKDCIVIFLNITPTFFDIILPPFPTTSFLPPSYYNNYKLL